MSAWLSSDVRCKYPESDQGLHVPRFCSLEFSASRIGLQFTQPARCLIKQAAGSLTSSLAVVIGLLHYVVTLGYCSSRISLGLK